MSRTNGSMNKMDLTPERLASAKRALETAPGWGGRRTVEQADVATLLASHAALEAENETLRLLICGGEDAPGYAASLPLSDITRVSADNDAVRREFIERATALEAKLREAAEKERAGIMRPLWVLAHEAGDLRIDKTAMHQFDPTGTLQRHEDPATGDTAARSFISRAEG